MPDTRTLGGGRPGQFRRPVASPTAGQNMIDTQRTPNVPRPQLPTVMPYQQPLTPEQPIPLGGGQQPIFNGPDFGGYDQQAVWRSLQDGQQTQQQQQIPPAQMPQPGPAPQHLLRPHLEQAPQQQPQRAGGTVTTYDSWDAWERATGGPPQQMPFQQAPQQPGGFGFQSPQPGNAFNIDPNAPLSAGAAAMPNKFAPEGPIMGGPVPTQQQGGPAQPTQQPIQQTQQGARTLADGQGFMQREFGYSQAEADAMTPFGAGTQQQQPQQQPMQQPTQQPQTHTPSTASPEAVQRWNRGLGHDQWTNPQTGVSFNTSVDPNTHFSGQDSAGYPTGAPQPPQGGTGAGASAYDTSRFGPGNPPPSPSGMPFYSLAGMGEGADPLAPPGAPPRFTAAGEGAFGGGGGPPSHQQQLIDAFRANRAPFAGAGEAGGEVPVWKGYQEQLDAQRTGAVRRDGMVRVNPVTIGAAPTSTNPDWLNASKSPALRHQIGLEQDPENYGKASVKMGHGTPNDNYDYLKDEAFTRQKMRRDQWRERNVASNEYRAAGVTANAKERASGRRSRLQMRKNVKAGMSPRMAFAMAQSKGKDGEFDFGIARAKFGTTAAIQMMQEDARTKTAQADRDALKSEGALNRTERAEKARAERKAAKKAEKRAADRAGSSDTRADERARLDRESRERTAKERETTSRGDIGGSFHLKGGGEEGGTVQDSMRDLFGGDGGSGQGRSRPFRPESSNFPQKLIDPKTGKERTGNDLVTAGRELRFTDAQLNDLLQNQPGGDPSMNVNSPRGHSFGIMDFFTPTVLPGMGEQYGPWSPFAKAASQIKAGTFPQFRR